MPVLHTDDHKYDRGVAVIYGAPKMTGATRLAAMACARVGAGLVKVTAPSGTGEIYRKTLPAHLIVEDEADVMPDDPRIKAVLAGPGWSPEDGAEHLVLLQRLLSDQSKTIILDAGAFLMLPDLPPSAASVVMTPHEGEFAKVFPDLQGSKPNGAEEAVRRTGGVLVLKGPETLITDGQQLISNIADAPQLATAGTGDVLAGMIAGLIAQGMPPMAASCAAVWIHGQAARRYGKGMVASDLPDLIPAVLQDLQR